MKPGVWIVLLTLSVLFWLGVGVVLVDILTS